MSKTTQKTFLVLNNQAGAALAKEITQFLLKKGYETRGICDDPRITIIIGLEASVQLWPNHERDSMGWLREIITTNLQCGGSALAFCPTHLSADQLSLIKTTKRELPENHGAHILVFPFYTITDFWTTLQSLPQDFAVYEDEE